MLDIDDQPDQLDRTSLITSQLTSFYSIPENMDKLRKIVNSPTATSTTPTVSLRTIDWFVSSTHLILYWVNNKWTLDSKSGGKYIDVYAAYNTQLKTHGKKYFDIFRRKSQVNNIISFNGIETTFSQLFFCKWIIETKLIDFIWENADTIRCAAIPVAGPIKIKSRKSTKHTTEVVAIIN